MKQAILILAFFFGGCLFLDAQVVEPPKPKPVNPIVKPTPLVPSTISAKGGELLVLDASKATGDVLFDWDPKLLSAKVIGKALAIAIPKRDEAQTLSVTVISFADKTVDRVSINVAGDKVAPKPPAPVDSNKAILDRLDKIENRLTNLEKVPVTPPKPVDSFQAGVQSAFEADGKPFDKSAKLAALYRVSGSTVNDPKLTKRGEILAKMHNAAQTVLEEPTEKVTILVNVRRFLANDDNVVLGKTDGKLDADTRALIASQFLKAQKALEGLK